jgi:hypothetical protein
MDALKHLCRGLTLTAVAAAASGAFAPTALAGGMSTPAMPGGSLNDVQIAYSSERYPVYQKVHREPEREKAEFARFEERTDADRAAQETDRKNRVHHRRVPYGIHGRD